jgi:Macrocin-O-methyltransferase (TylF)
MIEKYKQLRAAFDWMDEHGIPEGLEAFYEFGCYTGGSLKLITNYCERKWPNVVLQPKVWGFDSFEGLPEETKGVPIFEKFTEGSYVYPLSTHDDPVEHIRNLCYYDNLTIVVRKFDDLEELLVTDGMKPAILVHIDCDLHCSTKLALEFCHKNKLLQMGTLLAFDEYKTNRGYKWSGEERAWLDFVELHNINYTEIFRWVYLDKDLGNPITQCVFRIEDAIGQ